MHITTCLWSDRHVFKPSLGALVTGCGYVAVLVTPCIAGSRGKGANSREVLCRTETRQTLERDFGHWLLGACPRTLLRLVKLTPGTASKSDRTLHFYRPSYLVFM